MRSLGLLVLVLVLGLPGCASKPPVKVVSSPGKVIIDVQTLGEYPTTVRRVRLLDAAQPIWEVRTKQGTPQIHTLSFVVGANPVKLASPDTGEYELMTPETGNTFQLKAGTNYTIQIWGDSEHTKPVQATFRLQNHE